MDVNGHHLKIIAVEFWFIKRVIERERRVRELFRQRSPLVDSQCLFFVSVLVIFFTFYLHIYYILPLYADKCQPEAKSSGMMI